MGRICDDSAMKFAHLSIKLFSYRSHKYLDIDFHVHFGIRKGCEEIFSFATLSSFYFVVCYVKDKVRTRECAPTICLFTVTRVLFTVSYGTFYKDTR